MAADRDLRINIEASVAQLQKDMTTAVGIVDRASKDIRNIGKSFGDVFAALGVGLSVGGLAVFIKQQIDLADRLNDMHLRLGIGVRDLAGLKLLAEQSGSSLEGMAQSVKRLTTFLGEAKFNIANKRLADALQLPTDPLKALYRVGDVFEQLGPSVERNALAMRLFGRSWDELAPAFEGGSEKMRKTVELGKQLSGITEENAKRADEFKDRLKETETVLGSFGLTIGIKVIPYLQGLLEIFDRMTKMAGWAPMSMDEKYLHMLEEYSTLLDDIANAEKYAFGGDTREYKARLNARRELLEHDLAEMRELMRKINAPPPTEPGIKPGEDKNKKTAAAYIEKTQRAIDALNLNKWGQLSGEMNRLGIAGNWAAQNVTKMLAATEARVDANKNWIAQIDVIQEAELANGRLVGNYSKSLDDANRAIEFQTGLLGKNNPEKQIANNDERIRLETEKQVAQLRAAPEGRDQEDVARRSAELYRLGEQAARQAGDRLREQDEQARSFRVGFQESLKQIARDATNSAAQVNMFFTDMFQNMEDSLVTFVTDGKFMFRDFANSVIADLTRIAFRQLVIAPLATSLFGAGFFGGGRAGGGPVMAGTSYLIGEREPEIFTPQSSGVITPVSKMTPNVSINMVNRGLPMAAESREPRFDGERWVIDVVLRNLDSRGPLHRAIAGM